MPRVLPKGKESKEDDIVMTCPLGSVCEEIKDNKVHRCMWFTKIVGTDPNTGEAIKDWYVSKLTVKNEYRKNTIKSGVLGYLQKHL